MAVVETVTINENVTLTGELTTDDATVLPIGTVVRVTGVYRTDDATPVYGVVFRVVDSGDKNNDDYVPTTKQEASDMLAFMAAVTGV